MKKVEIFLLLILLTMLLYGCASYNSYCGFTKSSEEWIRDFVLGNHKYREIDYTYIIKLINVYEDNGYVKETFQIMIKYDNTIDIWNAYILYNNINHSNQRVTYNTIEDISAYVASSSKI